MAIGRYLQDSPFILIYFPLTFDLVLMKNTTEVSRKIRIHVALHL